MFHHRNCLLPQPSEKILRSRIADSAIPKAPRSTPFDTCGVVRGGPHAIQESRISQSLPNPASSRTLLAPVNLFQSKPSELQIRFKNISSTLSTKYEQIDRVFCPCPRQYRDYRQKRQELLNVKVHCSRLVDKRPITKSSCQIADG